MFYSPDSTHLFATSCPARPSMNKQRQRGPMTRIFFGIFPVQDQYPPMMAGCSKDKIARKVVIECCNGTTQGALTHFCETDRFIHAFICHQCDDRSKSLDL